LKHAAIYYRVSTDKQDLDSQQQAIDKWIADLPESKKPKKTSIFKDEGISGKTMRRPGFQVMLKAIFEKKFDALIVYRLDRLSRNATHAIKILLDIDEVGVSFFSVTQPVLNLGPDNPFRRTMLAAFAEIAEIERDTIVARVKAGLDAAKKRGVTLGQPKKIDRNKQIQARNLKKQGQSMQKIAKEMKLSVGTIHKLLQCDDLTD
tara:strand:+ start:797 stop:1411 length:615 start_codon:yes stop_codon:yes gene_type:complete